MITTDLRWSMDPVALATECLAFHPDPWQTAILRSGGKRFLLNCCRQNGKSTTTILKIEQSFTDSTVWEVDNLLIIKP